RENVSHVVYLLHLLSEVALNLLLEFFLKFVRTRIDRVEQHFQLLFELPERRQITRHRSALLSRTNQPQACGRCRWSPALPTAQRCKRGAGAGIPLLRLLPQRGRPDVRAGREALFRSKACLASAPGSPRARCAATWEGAAVEKRAETARQRLPRPG